MKFNKYIVLALLLSLSGAACVRNSEEQKPGSKAKIIKGLYSYGPEMRSFTDCEEGREYWVADSAKTLELAYSDFNFEKPYEPVYIEAEGYLKASDSLSVSASFDSTFVVTKLINISKEIPDGPCTQ